jgi:hypothetical protein
VATGESPRASVGVEMNAMAQRDDPATEAGEAVLALRALCRRFGDKLVVPGLDLELHAG